MNPINYTPPFGLRNAHLQTIYPTLFRKVPVITQARERITTPDDDFIDLDWAQTEGRKQLVVITHGLEGHSRSHYCQGMATAFEQAGWDALIWNFRGCSGEPNQQLCSYHSGATGELQIVLEHIFNTTAYQKIALIGFSLGGNLMLKYLGDLGSKIDSRIHSAVAISVPCDLASSAKQLEHWQNRIYMARFMRSLRHKVREKALRFPGTLNIDGLKKMRTFAEFDEAYTGPIHGFKGAHDYWAKCSCGPVLPNIAIPTLLINALDDPFLTPACFPHQAAATNPNFSLETPSHGGHLGFVTRSHTNEYWSEIRAVNFATN
ncbi:alpha/beta fold hydrolase [Coraliomargarita sp. SDUM461004]|uniref:Alpha/beta fold hydrolase n=1 Tax=Thalassobacterium sedimentorum TaxID=3041258 RepID=A0ABU1AFK8_9BACT|nr:alpha/beta fold hydrolase [Coraliomargarita sp. SDUM461004]MDQ8193543.1 alpha/beta fold hydrolase [Coraliomargarita sp. SDUM461004]